MALEDAIEKFIVKRVDSCPFAILVEKLNEKDRKVLLTALEKGIPGATLVSALRSEGYKIGAPAVNDHRRGKCRCGKK